MKNSFFWRNANIIRFIPVINFLFMSRFHILVYKGYITREKMYFLDFLVSMCVAVLVIPLMLLGDLYEFIHIVTCVINPIIVYGAIVLFDTLAIRDEQRVRATGFFWSPDNENR